MSKTKRYVLLSLIIGLAFFLRFYNIETAPPGVYPDEAVNGIDAMTALDTGNFQWFYTANNGREGLFMNLIAFSFKLLGTSVLALKLPSIIFGTLTVWGTYLLSKELFKKERFALTAAFLTAVSFWSINFSRIAFRAIMLPFVLVWSFYFLWKGMRDKKYSSFIWGGLIFGIGLHTYIAFRIAPAILAAMFLVFLLTRQNFWKNYWKQLLTFVFSAFITAAPMFYTFYIHPEFLESRSASVSVLSPEVNHGQPVLTLLRSLGLSLVKYNFWGDQNWRHNFPPYAILDPLTGVAFTFGLIYAILFFLRHFLKIFQKDKAQYEESHFKKFEIYTFLLLWFFAMLAPEFLTAEGNPHALRAIGTLPVTFILAALTFEFFRNHSDRHSIIHRYVTGFLVFLMLFSIGVFNSVKYHLVWAKKPEVARSFEENLMRASDYLKTLPDSTEKFVVTESMQRIPIQLFNWQKPNTEYVYPGQIQYLDPKNKTDFVIILTDRNDEVINYLQEKFPGLGLEERKDQFGLSYYIMKISN